MDYGAAFYFFGEMKSTGVDDFFNALDERIGIQERHTGDTATLYAKERVTKEQELEDNYDTVMKQASAKYDEAYEEIEGDDSTKHAYANFVADWGYLVESHSSHLEDLASHYVSMLDHHYTSAIISLYILLESELKCLCDHWKTLTNSRIGLSDFGHRDYLAVSYTYLDKVMGINMKEIEPFQNQLTDLQNLRNRYVHDAGVLTEDQVKRVRKVIESSQKRLVCELNGESFELKIKDVSYINDWYNVLRGFFEQLFWSIDYQMQHRFLIERFTYLFGVVNNKISIGNLSVAGENSKKNINFNVDCTDPESLFEISVKLTVTPASKRKVTTLNINKNNPHIERFCNILEENEHAIWSVLNGFYLTKRNRKITISLS